MQTVPAPTDTHTYQGRHRSRRPGWFAVGTALYEPRHETDNTPTATTGRRDARNGDTR